MKFGLRDDIVQNIQDVFSTFPEVDEVIIYGSRAKGNYKPGSDIDITLKGENLNLSTINAITLELEKLMLPYIFDISVFRQIANPDLIEHISRVGIVLYKPKVQTTKKEKL